jgi:hypothetical protein
MGRGEGGGGEKEVEEEVELALLGQQRKERLLRLLYLL